LLALHVHALNISRSLRWGNDAALRACFGENYKRASSISHCFQEHDTHNTCCMMDKETRDANDAAGNPIGQASLEAARQIAGKSAEDMPDSDDLLTPWCTCFGSQVCSHYAKTTKTKVKFVNDCGCASGTPGKGPCCHLKKARRPCQPNSCDARQKNCDSPTTLRCSVCLAISDSPPVAIYFSCDCWTMLDVSASRRRLGS